MSRPQCEMRILPGDSARNALRMALTALLASALALALGGCFLWPNEPPIAVISTDLSSGQAPFPIELDASGSRDSDGIVTTYRWSFGDGLTATGIAVEHVYRFPGTYAVQLTILDDDGASDIETTTVIVAAPNTAPIASFLFSPLAPTSGEPVSFDGSASLDTDGALASFVWSFGDGNEGTGVSATHAYERAGIYAATLTVTDNGGLTDSMTRTITVTGSDSDSETNPGENLAPFASFQVSSATGTIGEEFRFDASSSLDMDGAISSYGWSFGDGTSGEGALVTHAYAAAGYFLVRLTVSDNAGGTDTSEFLVSVDGTSGADAPQDPSDPDAESEVYTRNYTWSYGGRTRSLTAAIPASLYAFAVSQPRNVWPYRDYDEYVLDPGDDALMLEIATKLSLGDYYETVENALAFVQKIVVYQLDSGFFEYPRYPAETLVDEAGDCEDSAILYASLIRTLGVGARLAAVDTDGDGNTDHMMVLVPVDAAYSDTFVSGSRSFWEYDGRLFALAETASEGGYLALGIDPWNLEARDIQKTWDVSGFDHHPQLQRYVP